MSKFFKILVQELIKLGATDSEADELANNVNQDIYLDRREIKEIAKNVWTDELATREALNL